MNRLESWLLHVSTILLAATGFVYAGMHYLMKPLDPFSVVNHPLEPYLFSAHVIIAPLLVLAFGMILHGHILFKIGTGSGTARKSGLVMIPTFVVMVISGYLLQIITSDFRKTMVWVHLISGTVWAMFYLGHQLSSYKIRKRFRVKAAFVVAALLFLCPANADTVDPTVREVYLMGTTLRVVSFEIDSDRALHDTEMLIRAVEQTDQQLSTWKKESELSHFNAQPVNSSIPVSDSLMNLLVQLQDWCRKTDGAFDPGIGRLLETWGIHSKFRIPTAQEIHAAISRSGILHLSLDKKSGTATKLKDIWIDPGGFGKGEGLRRAMEIAKEYNMAPVLLDFGGQVAVNGEPPDGRGWDVRVANPMVRSQPQGLSLTLRTGSLSTSGFSERSGNVNGRIINHILDPKTGQPSEAFGAVTVWNSNPLVADVLSTALYVMGPEKGLTWASKHHVAAAFNTQKSTRETQEFVGKIN
jgi:thiamine biosynthesis lipoprotein